MSTGTYFTLQIKLLWLKREFVSKKKHQRKQVCETGKRSMMRGEQMATYALHKLAFPQLQLFIYHFLRTSWSINLAMDASIVANIDMTIVQFQRNVPILYGVVLQLFQEISVCVLPRN